MVNADNAVREVNVRLSDLNKRLATLKGDHDRLNKFFSRIIDSGASTDNPDFSIFTVDEIDFWEECESKFLLLYVTFISYPFPREQFDGTL